MSYITVHEHLLRILLTRIKPGQKLKLLDAGCGTLGLEKYLTEKLQGTGVEIEYFGYDVAGFSHSIDGWKEIINQDVGLKKSCAIENFVLVPFDPYNITFPDNFFDIVISNQVVEHVNDFSSFYSELDRTLKPLGIQIHCFPTKEILIEPHLRIPIVQKLLKKKYLFQYLKFMYLLKGENREKYIRERISYMKTDTNYRNRTYHPGRFVKMNYKILPSYNLFFLICRVQKLFRLEHRFKYFDLGIFEKLFGVVACRFYSITVIVQKNIKKE